LQNSNDSIGYSGRELVEFDGGRQETPPGKMEESRAIGSLVENGRVSMGDEDAEKEQETDLREGII
jgi:hypothetical protein